MRVRYMTHVRCGSRRFLIHFSLLGRFPMRPLRFLACSAALLIGLGSASASFAQETKIKFQLDWRFEGPSALFLVAKARGYFAQEKLDVTIDAGNGSGNAVNRVAS